MKLKKAVVVALSLMTVEVCSHARRDLSRRVVEEWPYIRAVSDRESNGPVDDVLRPDRDIRHVQLEAGKVYVYRRECRDSTR